MKAFAFAFVIGLLGATVGRARAEDAWCTWADHGLPGSPVYVSRLEAGAWRTETLAPSLLFSSNSAPALALGPDGELMVVWAARKGEKPPRIQFSRRRGGEWSAPRPVSRGDADWESFPALAVDRRGRPWAAWSRDEGGDSGVVCARWEGSSFGEEMEISERDDSPDVRPALAADASGRILVVWQGVEDGYCRIFGRMGGRNGWSEESLLSPEAATDQVLPSLSAPASGGWECAWRQDGRAVKSRFSRNAWSSPLSARLRSTASPLPPSCRESDWMIELGPAGSAESFHPLSDLPLASSWTDRGSAARAARASYVYTGYGDSITYGTTPPGKDGCYIPLLDNLLESAHPADDFYIWNGGFPGAETDQLLSGGGEWGCPGINSAIDITGCSMIFIMGGTNDVSHGYSPAYTKYNLGLMIDRARAKSCEPVVATIIPLCYHPSENAATTTLNISYIRPLQAEKGCRLADPWQSYIDYGSYCSLLVEDGVHPVYPAGAQPIAEAWFDALPPTPSPAPSASPPPTATPVPTATPRSLPIDYNGDGRADVGVYSPTTGLWAIREITRAYFGSTGDRTAPGDYDGDGTSEIAVFRPGEALWADLEGNRFYFGAAGDLPIPGDYDGDRTCDAAIFRPATGLWAVRSVTRAFFGLSGDVPVYTDFDRDGKTDIGVFRPSNGLWVIKGITRTFFGSSGDFPVPGSYFGAGTREQIAVLRPASGLWSIKDVTRIFYGSGYGYPQPADWNGDDLTDITGYWNQYVGAWASNALGSVLFGSAGDLPVSARVYEP